MHDYCVRTLIIESEWGGSEFYLNKPMSLHDIFSMLKAFCFRPEGITESKGVARVFHPGSFLDVYDLELQLISASIICGCKSKVVKEPNDFCPVLANFASICNEVEHATKTSRVGGTVPEGTEETEEQSREAPESNQLHVVDIKNISGHPVIQFRQEQTETGGDSEHVPAHYARDEMTGNEKLIYGVDNSPRIEGYKGGVSFGYAFDLCSMIVGIEYLHGLRRFTICLGPFHFWVDFIVPIKEII